jgi:UDP-2,3-diacylglucosamine pyrophosphatase LpxH
MRVESIFISDVHLGQGGCRAEELLDFLAATEARNIFVIGDLVVYIPGNHDEAAREFAGMNICGVEIRRHALHRTVDGRRMLLMHGDELDSAVRAGRLHVRLGAVCYGAALALDRVVLRLRRMLGLAEWSLTSWLKRAVPDARAYIAQFEETAARAAARAGCDGVICGHIHQPAVREIEGVLYCNDRDWVENGTALIESTSGRLSLLRWADIRARAVAQRPLRLLGSSKA